MKGFTHFLMLAVVIGGVAGCGPQTCPPPVAAKAVPQAAGRSPASIATKSSEPAKKKDTFDQDVAAPQLPDSPESAPPEAKAPTPNSDANPPLNPVSDSAGTRPKADREPTKPGDPEKITFDDLILGMQADMVFRPFMLTERAKELEGKRVRLTGEMYPALSGSKKLKEFILLRNTKCLYGKGGQADHVAYIYMTDGHTIDFTSGTVRVEGTLRIVPVNSDEDGTTKHIYVLEDAVGK